MKDAKTRKKDTSATDQSLFFSESGDSSLFDDLDDSILASIDLNVSFSDKNSKLNSRKNRNSSCRNDSESKTEKVLKNSADDAETQAKTPQASSLHERMKQKIARNRRSSASPAQSMQSMRENMMAEALEEVERIRCEFTEFDTGPFYGLPSKVQSLLQSVRGIQQLYGT